MKSKKTYLVVIWLVCLFFANQKVCISSLRSDDFATIDSIKPLSVFKDTRDGQSYKCVNIGGQVWLAENFRYNPDLKLPVSISKNFQNSFPANGVLYDVKSAQEAVPEGWHIPSAKECYEMIRYFGATDTSRCMQQYDKLICYSNDVLHFRSEGDSRYYYRSKEGKVLDYKFPGYIFWTSTYTSGKQFGSGYYDLVINEKLGRVSVDKTQNVNDYYFLRLIKNAE